MERSWNCHLRWGSELYPRVCLGQWEAGMMAARPIRGQNAAEVSGLNAATAKPLSPSFHHTCISLCTRKVSSFQDGKRRDKRRMDDSVCKSSHILNLKCTENISFLFSLAQSSDIVRMYRSLDLYDQHLIYKRRNFRLKVVNIILLFFSSTVHARHQN